MDELSVAFEGSRKVVNIAIDKICEFTGTKLIFWDMRTTFIDGLYSVSVSQARMDKVVSALDPVSYLYTFVSIIYYICHQWVILYLASAVLLGLGELNIGVL
jgi:hypothetical protein